MSEQESSKLKMLHLKLKTVTKEKLCIERHVYSLRNKERSLGEELYSVESEIELLSEQLKVLKDKLHENNYKLSTIKIQTAADKSRWDNALYTLQDHMKDFEYMFAEDRNLFELRNKELIEKEAQELEQERQKRKETEKKNELLGKEAIAIEQECDVIERECAVLKKRNAAIMLKLRRRLVETEDARRELISKRDPTTSDDGNNNLQG